MTLELQRKEYTETYTLGSLSCCGVYICDTLEPRCFVKGFGIPKSKSALPARMYPVLLGIKSSFYSNYQKHPFAEFVQGKIPRLGKLPVQRNRVLILPSYRHLKTSPEEICVGFYTNGVMLKGGLAWQELLDKYWHRSARATNHDFLKIKDDDEALQALVDVLNAAKQQLCSH